MGQELRTFIDQYTAMDTRLLLQRYRAGGLMPEAEAALLLVLAERGYAGDALPPKGVPHDEAMEPPAKPPSIPRVTLSHPRLRKFNLALKSLIIPVAAFFLLLAIPIIGNFVVLGGASLLGCRIGEDNIHPCRFLFWDIGKLVYGYVVDMFVLGAINPFLSASALFGFIRSALGAVWLWAVIGVFVAREVTRHRIKGRG
jgi:hypothetical protein